MSDLNIQLRDYFDANVERVTADDVFAGRLVAQQPDDPQPRWRSSPRFAVGLGFAMTVFIVGGSVGLGLALLQPGDGAASGGASYGVGTGTPASTGWGVLGIAAILAVIALIFIVLALRSTRRGSQTKGRKEGMGTTLDTPQVDHKLEEAHRANRWLIAAVVVLAVALVALGAWVVSDLTGNTAEAPAEVQALLDDYNESWNTYDGEAFLGSVSDEYMFFDDHTVARNAELTALLIENGSPYGFTTELDGDYLFVVNRDGNEYVASAPFRLGTDAAPDSAGGVSTYRIVNLPDVGWKISYHTWVGELPSS